MNEDMRGLFFVAQGQYQKGVEPKVVNRATGDVIYLGGYDPQGKDTTKWYMVMDKKTFHCVACGGDLDKVLKSVYNAIVKHKGSAKSYFKHVSSITSDDYYETHYLGKSPLTHDQHVKKAEGRCPRVSPAMRCLYEEVYKEYGDHFSEEVAKIEDLAYNDIIEKQPITKCKRLISKNKTSKMTLTPTPKKEVIETSAPKKTMPKIKVGVKKLSMV